jgi:hypothetical protein
MHGNRPRKNGRGLFSRSRVPSHLGTVEKRHRAVQWKRFAADIVPGTLGNQF